MSKHQCHTGNPLVFEALGVKVYAGGNTRNGGWMQMDPKPDLAIGPQGVIRTARTMDKFPMGWACGSKVTTKKTPLLIELEWPDYSIPTNVGRDFWVQLVDDIKTNDIKSVSTQCMGGHGRTGVQLCILAHMMIPQAQHTWKNAGELIQYIRDVYCDHAVEAPSQQKYIADVLEIPHGDDKIAVQSVSGNDIWAGVNYKFDPDEMVIEDDKPKRNKRKKNKNGKAKSYTNGNKRLPANTGAIRGHLLYHCESCGDYEFRSTLISNGDIPCEVCYKDEMSFQMGEDSLRDDGDLSCRCDSCGGDNYHPLEMFDNRTCKLCWLEEHHPEWLHIENKSDWRGRKFFCPVSKKKHPIVFSVFEDGMLIAANKSKDYKDGEKKKTTLDNFGMRVKVPEITGSISLADIQNEMDMDDIGEIVKSNSVTTLLQHYRDAEKKKDKQLMKIIEERLDELA